VSGAVAYPEWNIVEPDARKGPGWRDEVGSTGNPKADLRIRRARTLSLKSEGRLGLHTSLRHLAASEALHVVNSAIALAPHSAAGYIARGYILGGWDIVGPEALPDFKRAVEVEPRSALAKVALGRALCAAGLYKEASEAFGEAIELDPECFQAYQIRAITLWSRGDFGAAIASAESAFKLLDLTKNQDLYYAERVGEFLLKSCGILLRILYNKNTGKIEGFGHIVENLIPLIFGERPWRSRPHDAVPRLLELTKELAAVVGGDADGISRSRMDRDEA
jgi:tetratricopeptide (TPR) repeat protein